MLAAMADRVRVRLGEVRTRVLGWKRRRRPATRSYTIALESADPIAAVAKHLDIGVSQMVAGRRLS